jgi:hypothetical protein
MITYEIAFLGSEKEEKQASSDQSATRQFSFPTNYR